MLLLTAAEMRALDAATIGGGVPGETLMERAGRGVAAALERAFGSPLAMRVLVCLHLIQAYTYFSEPAGEQVISNLLRH